MTDETKLLPCPFCGEAEQDTLLVERLTGTVIHPAYRVVCDNCGGSSGYSDRGAHVEMWNTRALAASQPADPVANAGCCQAPPPPEHYDDYCVRQFAKLMSEKMAASRAKGRSGWHDPEKCSVEYLRSLLYEHLDKGDPVDVANFCMMLRHYNASTYREFCNCTPKPAPVTLAEALQVLDTDAERFDQADWFWRTMDPDDSADTPSEVIHRSMVGHFCVCEIASSYTGPTRYGFVAPVLDQDSDHEEFLHFATQQEAIDAVKDRISALRAIGEGEA